MELLQRATLTGDGARAKAHLVSHWIRDRTERNVETMLDERSISELLRDLRQPAIREQAHALLAALARRSPFYGKEIQVPGSAAIAMASCRSNDELGLISAFLHDSALAKLQYFPNRDESYHVLNATISFSGWEEVEKLRSNSGSESRVIFVAMWFTPKLELLYEKGILPAINQAGYEAYRVDRNVDRDQKTKRIDAEIMVRIRSARAVVVDATGRRASAFFEAGFADGLGKPVLWTMRKKDEKKMPFDTRQFPHILWETPEGLAKDLRWMIEQRLGPAPPAAAISSGMTSNP